MQLDYRSLPREFPRRYVPADTPFDLPTIERFLDELKNRELLTAEDLEKWLADESELSSIVFEEKALRNVLYTTQTDNAQYERDYLRFVQDLEPRIKVGRSELDKKFVACPAVDSLPMEYYRVLVRSRSNSVSIFRPENVELEKRDEELAQRYQKICAAMTVHFRGEERTMQQMDRFLEETDRASRFEAWHMAESRRLSDIEALDSIYDEQINIRTSIARNAGFDNFRDYSFRKFERFDYSPEDCYALHDAIERHFVPLRRQIDRERMLKLGVDELRPWDLAVDPDGMQPLRPFGDSSELVRGCIQVFQRVDPAFAGYFSRLVELSLLDLESRKGKAPGGYQTTFTYLRLPFIFTNVVGRDQDVRTLCHEAGHSFHTFLVREQDFPFDYRYGMGSEIAEVASMSMELISGEHFEGTFYDSRDAKRSNQAEYRSFVRLVCWVATIDAFQHWVYTHPGHSREEREEEWLKTFRRFGGLESWEGFPESERDRWQRQLHLFEFPFYYIEYAIAALGALGIWTRYRKEPREAVEAYKRSLSLGGSRPLPELFEAADLPWGFGPSVLERYANELKAALM